MDNAEDEETYGRKMNRVPLLVSPPLEGMAASLDVSPIMREIFRDRFEKDISTRTTEVTSKLCKDYQNETEGIKKAELELMKLQGKILKRNVADESSNIEDIPVDIANKYNLIRLGEVISKHKINTSTVCHHLPKMTLSDDSLIKQSNEDLYCIKKVFKVKPLDKKITLTVDPDNIFFDHYVCGKEYKRQISLRNNSIYSCKVRLVQGSQSDWNVKFNKGLLVTTVVPGVTKIITVTFTPTSLEPCEDSFIILTEDGTKIELPLKAIRIPPLLTTLGELETCEELTKKDLVLSGTIDCGSKLIGSVNVLIMRLKNIGSDGTFFITNELDWAFTTIKNEDNYYKAEMEPFSISPAVFSLAQNEYISLEVTFEPLSEGTFTEHFKVICNNNSMRTIDIIADATTFVRNSLVFEEIDKTFSIDIEDDEEAEYYIKLSVSNNNNNPVVKAISVVNTSDSKFEFRWDWRMPNINSPFIPLTDDYIQVSPGVGTINALSSQMFLITTTQNELADIDYKGILRFVVCGLPFLAISESDHKFILQEEDGEMSEQWYNSDYPIEEESSSSCFRKKVDLNCGEIEVWLKTMPAVITLSTYYIEFKSFKHSNVNYEITVNSCSKEIVSVEWVPINWKFGKISMDPQSTNITPLESFTFHLSVILADHIFYHELVLHQKYRCVVNEGESYIELSINGIFYKEEEMPRSIFQDVFPHKEESFYISDYIIFDPIMVMGSFAKPCEEILRQRAPNNMELIDIKAVCEMIQNKIDYNLVGEKLYCHIMHWVRNKKEDFTWTLLDVQIPDVEADVVCIKKTWFIDCPSESTFKLKNYSKLKVNFSWRDGVGLDKKILNVTVEPKSGILEPMEEKLFTAYITPLDMGIVTDLYITCTIEAVSYPICVAICGEVRNLLVNIAWQAKDNPMSIDWHEGVKSVESLTDICQSAKTTKLEVSNIDNDDYAIIKDYDFSESGEQTPTKVTSEKWATVTVDSNFTLEALVKSLAEGESKMDKISSASTLSNLYVDWPIIGGKYRLRTPERKSSRIEFKEIEFPVYIEDFKEESEQRHNSTRSKPNIYDWLKKIMEEKAITFNLKVNEKASQDIIVKNLTPRVSRLKAISQIFHRHMGADLEDSKCYRFFNNPDCWGVIMETEPMITCLEGDETIRIKLNVLGDTWGDYIDVLVLSFPVLPSFSIPIVIHVKGMPIYATFAPKNPEPLLKFGYLFPGEVFCQTVIFKNITFLPLKIVWNVYTIPDEDELSIDEQPPFTLAFDVHNERPTDFCKPHIMEYLGKLNASFKVCPDLMYLKPYGEAKLKVTLDTAKYMLYSRNNYRINNKIEGTIIGAIYVNSDKGRNAGICDRDTGYSTDLFKMSLSANIQVPRIKIVNFQCSDFEFFVRASTLLSNPDYKMRKMLFLKNIDDTTANIQLFVYHPFYITNLKHSDMNMVCLKDFRAILIKNQLLEVELQFAPGEQDILQPSEVDLSTHEPNIAKMLIYQGDLLTEEFTFNFTIIYPNITVWKERIVFGPVFVNNTKRKFIAIRSHDGDEKVSFLFESETSNFSVQPESGILKMGEPFELGVLFTPSESTMYLNKLIVQSQVPSYKQIITLEGVGTWNSKFQCSY